MALSPTVPRTMPGRGRCSAIVVVDDDDGDDIDGDARDDHDSIPHCMFISRKEEDREAGIP